MPQPDDAASQHSSEGSLKERRPSLTDSDADTDTFEDAVDAASVRSLTKRSVSNSKPQPPPPEADATKSDADSDSEEEEEEEEANSVKSEEKPEPPSRGSSPVSHRISNISNTSNLDVVNLDDDAAPQHQDPASPSDKDQLSRTTSLNNTPAAAQPSSPDKSLPPIPTASTATPAAAPPAAAPTPAPAPVGRRLTSPFSWLSRNSSKDKDVNSTLTTQPSARRNTASSVGTVGSNPEMMLSKLEEEREGDGKASNRNSLKDRFKVLRMQQESGAPLTINTEDIPDETAEGEALPAADLPPKSPLPPPNASLAPGTAVGISVGPSETATSQVDWDLWQSVVYEGPAAVARSSAEELNKAIATGIPSAIRGVIWQVLAQSKSEDLEGVYRDLLARGTEKENRNRHSSSTAASSFSNANLSVQSGDGVASSASSVNSEQSGGSGVKGDKKEDKNAEAIAKAQAAAVAERMRKEKEDIASIQRLEKVIRRDLGARTSYSKYAAAAGLQEGLFGVCKAYALFDEGVGYAQGMNFLIMPLLFNMPEQEAFCLLVRLMNHYGLRDLFIHDMPGLHRHLYQFERLLEDLEPALYCHLHRRGISPHLYATPWFLTLFAYRFPLQLVLRIYDLILSEGLSAIIRFGIVLMQKNTATLLEISDMQQLTTYLKDKLFDVYIDKDPSQGSLLENGFFGSSSSSIDKEIYRADQLVRDACEIKLSAELLEGYTAEWEEKTKAEKERETEVKELRTNNQSLTIKVRKLEERVEVADREQADLATELVHTKVENDELKDEVEALRNQVQELKKVIENQPLEIEETWKLERDDLMKRNEKVHLENEKVEKELAELEEELVQTKLRYAEIAGQHETLSRKWTELKRQFV
ncbi:rab-GTPase-TBC domain-containing protein [Trichoderma breve]|uniref:GTPase-activating protein GYP5 n=1 Tax=Trichoderma breve TaxID=2034170 RepID=A0A9W9BDI5_9HYPO|nr:rab-GTPase-TBC domain-containing protein [Trichoderma breve]KAJ4860492.1 rab-GTPase-TBC domain-containing protein [Trichoderma breve]